MASSYPGSLDSFDTIASDKKTSDSVGGRTHRQMHNDLGDAIEAVQAELGTDPAGAYATVKARFEAIEGSTLPQIDAKGDLIVGTADNTYDNLTAGTNDTVLVADSAQTKGVKWAQVSTAGIADSAVTSAKIADGTIVNADISATAAIDASKIANLGNRMTTNQASIETDTTGWAAYGNCTIARSTAQAASGSASLAITVTGAGGTVGAEATYVDVTPGETYTAVASFRADSTARNVAVQIVWKTSGNAYVSYDAGTAMAGSNSGWVDVNVTAVAPATAARAVVTPVAYSTVAGEVHYLDKAGLWVGAGGLWQAPGAPIPNLGIRSNPSNTAQAQVWNPGNNSWITV